MDENNTSYQISELDIVLEIKCVGWVAKYLHLWCSNLSLFALITINATLLILSCDFTFF